MNCEPSRIKPPDSLLGGSEQSASRFDAPAEAIEREDNKTGGVFSQAATRGPTHPTDSEKDLDFAKGTTQPEGSSVQFHLPKETMHEFTLSNTKWVLCNLVLFRDRLFWGNDGPDFKLKSRGTTAANSTIRQLRRPYAILLRLD